MGAKQGQVGLNRSCSFAFGDGPTHRSRFKGHIPVGLLDGPCPREIWAEVSFRDSLPLAELQRLFNHKLSLHDQHCVERDFDMIESEFHDVTGKIAVAILA